MLIVISPAKTLDFENPPTTKRYTQPDMLEESTLLIERLRRMKPGKIADLMKLSPKLATLNAERYRQWSVPFTIDNAKQAVLAFKGDVYTGLDAESFNSKALAYAQKHLRILSGLYGVLRPLDLMQPYRLEMGTRLQTNRGRDLYAFWGELITSAINRALKQQKDDLLINLASNEYFKSIKTKQLQARVITPQFKEKKNGQYKIISFFAKQARGMMARYIIQNQLTGAEDIKSFQDGGYTFNKKLSKENEWVFTRTKSK